LTTTLNEQESTRCRASVAVQVTAVVPIGNIEPAGGAHATDTVGAPPVTIGVPYCTAVAWPLGDVTAGGASGQEIFGPFGNWSIGVGFDGLLHEQARIEPTSANRVTARRGQTDVSITGSSAVRRDSEGERTAG
ncbi:MAG TPA: hypothetical protein VHJ79_10605, partial [Mycobacterium sp.]|nr:hypothetical protein [Mycobacterium sp.]